MKYVLLKVGDRLQGILCCRGVVAHLFVLLLASAFIACAGATPQDDQDDTGRSTPDVRATDTQPPDTDLPDVQPDLPDDGDDVDTVEPDVPDTPDTPDAPDVPQDVRPDLPPDVPDTPDVGCRGPGCACNSGDAAVVCEGLACVDGYCCDEACDGVCESCGLAGSEGRCSPYGTLNDPESECTQTQAASCGTTGWCDGAGACEFYGTGVFCDDGEACSTGDHCDGAGNCAGDLPPTCGPGEGNECCVGGCNDGAGCQTSAGTCADSCGPNELVTGASCTGCGPAGAVGTCTGAASHRCDALSHNPCRELSCGGDTYWCTNIGSVWAWRQAGECDDGDPCTYADRCAAGSCGGTTVDCSDDTCADRECNGSAACTVIPKTGAVCNDGNLCTYNDRCDSAGNCDSGTSITCVDSPCIDRECNGTGVCDEFVLSGTACDDGDPCTWGDVCAAGAICQPGTTIDCAAQNTTCMSYSCNGTSQCTGTPQNVGSVCDDGDPATDDDVCLDDGSCEGDDGCPPPAEACAMGFQSRERCENARVVGRVEAGRVGGVLLRDTTCNARDRFNDSSGCWDANGDHAYRLYMREGESVALDYQTSNSCDGFSSWSGTLKIFENGGCGSTSCDTKVYCEDRDDHHQTTYIAPRDGWVIIVADGSHASDDDGIYELTLVLTCSTGDCGCN